MLDFTRLVTPPEHGDTLVEPGVDQWAELLESNGRLIGTYQTSMAGCDFQSLRKAIRERIAGTDRSPVIVIGHQPEFIHSGVWAKQVMAHRLAKATSGSAVNLIADHDAPKSGEVLVPRVEEDERVNLRRIRVAEVRSNVPYESLPPLHDRQIQEMEADFREAVGTRMAETLLEVFLGTLRHQPPANDWVDQVLHARQATDASFGLSLQDRRVSETWTGPLLAAILADAPAFAAAYNRALSRYRQMEGIRGNRHPMPDLGLESDRFEVPVWCLWRGGPRQRVWVSPHRDRLTLFADRQMVGDLDARTLNDWTQADEALRSLSELQFRPRALTLTLWARLLLADLFIHGIGGAKYDRITDLLIEDYYGFRPPAMTCVSATLRLPLPRHDVSPSLVATLRWRLRDLRHNPARQLPASERLAELNTRKQVVLQEMAVLTRRNGAARGHRRDLFLRIHDLNARMVSLCPEMRARWEWEVGRAERQMHDDQIGRGREFFFALHSRRDLTYLMSRLPDF